jgi:UDP-N-acetylglucosamine 2-epimerase
MNPKVREIAGRVLGNAERIHLIEPLQYQPFVNLMAKSYLIITDSGGMQEEAPSLGKPVLVVRRETERPEAVEAGTVKLAGVSKEMIYRMTKELLIDGEAYGKMARAVNPYGDGHACERIIRKLLEYEKSESPADERHTEMKSGQKTEDKPPVIIESKALYKTLARVALQLPCKA